MENLTSIQKEFKKFYVAYATAQVVKEEFAMFLSKSTGQNYQDILNALDTKIKERLKADSLLPEEPVK